MRSRGVTYIEQYLDDFITMGPSGTSVCQCNLDTKIKTCLDLGFSINPSKLVQPTTCLEFLGIILDTEKMEMRISDQRMDDILEELDI